MITFSLNASKNDAYSAKIWDSISRNIRYFKKFNVNWEEAAQRTYIACLDNQDSRFDDLDPYVKKLARNIMKIKQQETPHDMYNERGDVSYVFNSLSTSINDADIVDKVVVEAIKDKFRELYLMDEEEFIKLRALFVYDLSHEKLKEFGVKNSLIKSEFSRIVQKYGSNIVFYALYDFLKELASKNVLKNGTKIRELQLKEGNYTYIDRIPDTPQIRAKCGGLFAVDRNTLEMGINPDYVSWETVFKTSCDILKIDISPLIDYMYTEIFVEEGVDTKHIKWCGSKYKLTSPGGYTTISVERNKFLSLVRAELILNLLMNNIVTIIALSPDSVYLKPTRATQLEALRLRLAVGKVIDLPVSIHIKNRLFIS